LEPMLVVRSPEAAAFYEPPASGWPPEGSPWEGPGPKLAALMESWRRANAATPGCRWLRSLRPLPFPLDPQMCAVFRGDWPRMSDIAFTPDGRCVVAWFRPDVPDNCISPAPSPGRSHDYRPIPCNAVFEHRSQR
jgi:hypothetical protein